MKSRMMLSSRPFVSPQRGRQSIISSAASEASFGVIPSPATKLANLLFTFQKSMIPLISLKLSLWSSLAGSVLIHSRLKMLWSRIVNLFGGPRAIIVSYSSVLLQHFWTWWILFFNISTTGENNGNLL